MSLVPSLLLRRTLVVDAILSGAFGLILLAGADLFADLLELPADLVRYAGLILLPFAVWVGWLARQERVARTAMRTMIAINLAWAFASVLILALGWVAPNVLGTLFLLVQALLVLGFAAVEILGLRGSSPEFAPA